MKSKLIYIISGVILSFFVISAGYGRIDDFIKVLAGNFSESHLSSEIIGDGSPSDFSGSVSDRSVSSSSTDPSVAESISDRSSAIYSALPSRTPSPFPTVTSSPAQEPVPTRQNPAPTKTAVLTDPLKLDGLIGLSRSAILEAYGNPLSRERSEYGSTWYIYHNRYKRFIMIGIKDDIVTNVFSNSADLQIFGISQGTARDKVRLKLKTDCGLPLTSIMKGTARYPISDTDQKDVFTDGKAYYTFFYDITNGNTLTSVQIAGIDIEQDTGLFPAASEEMVTSMENISFSLMNAIRVRMGKPVLRWDSRIAAVARAHSLDMAVHDYFGHISPPPDGSNAEGLSPGDRLKEAGLSYLLCAENIARNHPNSICAFETFMNSAGHRKNMLSATGSTGIGVYMGEGEILLTQMFVTLSD